MKMIVKESRYKDISAVEIETKEYTVTVLPSEGGKIASFKTKSDGKEYFLQNPAPKYGHVGLKDSYVDGECSGFDDMFPTIDPVVVKNGSRQGLEYPDHGEVCRLPFSYTVTERGLEMRVRSETLRYEYKKTITEDAYGKLCIVYEIENLSDDEFHVLWAGHCLIKAEQGGRVLLPYAEGAQTDIMFDTVGRFGKAGDRIPLQKQHLLSVWQDGVKECRKYYFPEGCKEGYVAYRYPNGKTFVIEFDKETLPYIGVWLNFGYVKDYYCIGLEPCCVGYDTVENAKKYGQKKMIPVKGKMMFTLTLSVKAE